MRSYFRKKVSFLASVVAALHSFSCVSVERDPIADPAKASDAVVASSESGIPVEESSQAVSREPPAIADDRDGFLARALSEAERSGKARLFLLDSRDVHSSVSVSLAGLGGSREAAAWLCAACGALGAMPDAIGKPGRTRLTLRRHGADIVTLSLEGEFSPDRAAAALSAALASARSLAADGESEAVARFLALEPETSHAEAVAAISLPSGRPTVKVTGAAVVVRHRGASPGDWGALSSAVAAGTEIVDVSEGIQANNEPGSVVIGAEHFLDAKRPFTFRALSAAAAACGAIPEVSSRSDGAMILRFRRPDSAKAFMAVLDGWVKDGFSAKAMSSLAFMDETRGLEGSETVTAVIEGVLGPGRKPLLTWFSDAMPRASMPSGFIPAMAGVISR